ncbi:L-threonylcarbamoyladenylate synthase [Faecalibacter bovis]|uniref:L-threonylcarbamoyladenylate synthase n=1 Tax=Faecalibacter bovis TaxID=2898187 RepID=A0ABX7XBH0_9FLAO|nr:L-threonylcarbamoyladenylate synthase [Faecalibacter bovis]QTV05205.1 threonylcarbamoyl-AMP synthase [Faecalibacter bovis]
MSNIHEIVEQLNEGKTMLYPTDTILGIGCSAKNEEAIQKIFDIKNRPSSKSLIILVDSPKMLQDIVEVPELAWDLMDFNEKPITIIYDNPKGLPKSLIAEDNTIAIRLTDDLLCKKIIGRLKAPIVSTSANLSGEASPKIFSEVNPAIVEGVDIVLNECKTFDPQFTASTIIKLGLDNQVKVIRE